MATASLQSQPDVPAASAPAADPAPSQATGAGAQSGAGATPPDPTGSPSEPQPQGAGAGDTAPTGSEPPEPANASAHDRSEMVPRARIDREVREKWEARRRAEAAEQDNARLRALHGLPQPQAQAHVPQAQPEGSAYDPAAIDQLVQRRAAEIAAAQEFDRRCNDVYSRGKRDIPDFDAALANFGMFGGLSAHPEFVDAVTQLDDSPQVLHYLGTHPDEAEHIMSMRGAKQGVALGQLSTRLGSPVSRPTAAPATRAPAPVAPVRGAAAPKSGPDDSGKFADQDNYRKWREANFRKR